MRDNNTKVMREISVGFALSGLLFNVLIFAVVFQLFRLLQALFDDSSSAIFRGILLP